MAEESTRRLLKVFGVSVTECEDALAALAGALGDPAGAGGAPGVAQAADAYAGAARELLERWTEVSRLVLDYQVRAQAALAAHLRPPAR